MTYPPRGQGRLNGTTIEFTARCSGPIVFIKQQVLIKQRLFPTGTSMLAIALSGKSRQVRCLTSAQLHVVCLARPPGGLLRGPDQRPRQASPSLINQIRLRSRPTSESMPEKVLLEGREEAVVRGGMLLRGVARLPGRAGLVAMLLNRFILLTVFLPPPKQSVWD